MMKELKFAIYSIKLNIKSNAELRTSFLMSIIGMMINNISFIIIWAFFVKSVGVIGGWTVADVIALQGFTSLCFGIVFSVGNGIRELPKYVSGGVFDRFMLSPKNILVRTATSSLGVSAIGDVFFGIICLVVYAFLIHASLAQIFLLLFLCVVTTVMFFSVAVVIFSTSFLFTDANSATESLFQLFFTPALFHGGVFQGVMRFVFTFIFPSLLIGGIPVEIVRDTSISKIILVTSLTVIWFVLSLKVFNKALKKYESSNFMTFGG